MDYQQLLALRQHHPAWRLLRADHAPLIASFFSQTFVAPNRRSLDGHALAALLDDQLYTLRQNLGDEAFPRSAAAYLDEWADNANGWLRKYYPPGQDEAHFELTPASEKAIEWLESLGKRQFVGTESRLLSIFELLRQVVEGSESDPRARLAELEKRRAALDEEIAQVRAGDIELMDATRVKERFLDVARTARSLLADFREVEQNFRDLDRQVRERIATWEGGKGALLGEIFGERDAISDSDQGRSFRAFWEFLMSPARQAELSELLHKAFALDPVQELEPDRRLLRMHYDWLEAGESAQRTVARLSEQLRRYLDDQAWLENRRIMQLLRAIESHALELRERAPEGDTMSLDATGAELRLALDRPLYSPPLKPRIAEQILLEGEADSDADALFEQNPVDKARLQAQIRQALRSRPRISLGELLELYPLRQGLAELVTYLDLAANDRRSAFDEQRPQLVAWQDEHGLERRASIPLVVFSQ
jgi:flagellar motility protein MotE (MotC chaperone)